MNDQDFAIGMADNLINILNADIKNKANAKDLYKFLVVKSNCPLPNRIIARPDASIIYYFFNKEKEKRISIFFEDGEVASAFISKNDEEIYLIQKIDDDLINKISTFLDKNS